MKVIAMIPARLGSTRVPRKNLRYLGDKPLLAWVTQTALSSQLFDSVVINSESDEIGILAGQLGAKFYKRSELLASDGATSEHFVTDFLNKHECDVLFQITPTSPFLTVENLQQAMKLIDDGAETVLSVKRIQAECFLNEVPMNFDRLAPMLPSQDLVPVDVMCNGIFAWRSDTFLRNGLAATYGGLDRLWLLELDGDASLDIDTEDDFQMAEAIVAKRERSAVRYWSSTEHTERIASLVLFHDGVPSADLRVPEEVNLDRILQEIPPDGGARRVVNRRSNCATVISQMPGEGNRRHYHSDCDEWWLILEGMYDYEVAGSHRTARKGDIISIERGSWHQITAIGDSRASRLAVSRDMVPHVYHD
jgi:CMP-N-acetylneuraminic acid synthetase/quercetin dioxygenase-like cupin family protein